MEAKLIPVKNKILITLFSFFILSCTNEVKSRFDESLTVKKEKKETRPVKLKKKERKKLAVADKRKTETPVATTGSNEINSRANVINNYAGENGYSTKYCFLIDMSLPSGRKRFFVYDLERNSIIYSGLVAHGSCNETFLPRAKFSNAPNCGCSSLGKYKVGAFYNGKYGKSYRLYGLDNSNSNAFKRAVVIHGYDCVPDEEISPMVLCNSQGCAMVSYNFFDKLSGIINKSEKPIILWVYR